MESRSTVLIVLFVVLLGTAGFYYWGPITKYASEQKLLDKYPTVRKTINYGLTTAGFPKIEKSINGSNVRTKSITKYRRAVVNSLPVNSLNWVELFRSSGVTGRVDFSLRSETRNQSEPSSLEGSLELASFKTGEATGTLSIESTDQHQFTEATIKAADNAIAVSIPELDLRVKTPSFFGQTGGGIGWGLSRFMSANVQKTETTTWRAHKVHQITLKSSEGMILRLYVTRDKQRNLVGAQAIAENDKWEREFVYASNAAKQLNKVRTYKNEDRVSTLTVSRGGERRELAFSNPNAEYLSTVRLEFLKGSDDNFSAEVVVESTASENPLNLGQFDVQMTEGLPESLRFEVAYGGSESFPVQLSGELVSGSLNWVTESSEIALNESGSETASPLQLVRKVIQGNTLKLAAREDKDQDTDEAETSGQADEDTETEPEEGPTEESGAADADTDQRMARSGSTGRESTDGKPDEPSSGSEPQPRSSDRSSTDRPIPYPDLHKAPRNSGETIHRSHDYNYPYSEPPKSYQSAQQDYYDGDFDRARKKLQKLLQRYPKSVNVNYLLGVIHYELGNPDEARRYFEAVFDLRHDPQLRAWSKHYLAQLGDTTAIPAN